MSENMGIWNQVCTTDKQYTKEVAKLNGGFTAIDCQYQIMRATQMWGAVGQGWGYDVANERIVEKGNYLLFVCDVYLWYGNKDQKIGPIPTMNAIIDGSGRLDDDACKKAVTDGLSKLFSHLGFSADIYLGMLDGNKYAGGKKSAPPKGKPPVREPQPKQSKPASSNSAPPKVQNLTKEQIEGILNLQKSLGVDSKALSTHVKAKYGASFPNAPASSYQSICVWLKEQGKSNKPEDNQYILEFGLVSSRSMLRKDYDRICAYFQNGEVRNELPL